MRARVSSGSTLRLIHPARAALMRFHAYVASDFMWQWLPRNQGDSRQSFSEWMTAALASRARGVELPFATVEQRSDRAIGSTRYLALRTWVFARARAAGTAAAEASC